MVNRFLRVFPGLMRGGFQVTSPPDREYNCIAWTVGDTTNWWWPGADLKKDYWPPGVVREVTISAFQAAFATCGFMPCQGEELEPEYEKIALFADADGKPTHAARQLPSGRWTSKLGRLEDIEHDLYDVVGELHGAVVLLLKRPKNAEKPDLPAPEQER